METLPATSKEALNLKLGIYEHYKGLLYQVLGVALHSETLEEYIIYKALYGDKKTWIRPLKMFLENVEIDKRVLPRFKYLREKL
ncbi:MAG TPA: DUF1653 domain-containing protein [Chlamydiales bacterium]|nr:DUF1653 domain-containing protein [Chlamydiales bacterium]